MQLQNKVISTMKLSIDWTHESEPHQGQLLKEAFDIACLCIYAIAVVTYLLI